MESVWEGEEGRYSGEHRSFVTYMARWCVVGAERLRLSVGVRDRGYRFWFHGNTVIHHHSFKIHRNRQQQQQQLGGKKASQAEEDFKWSGSRICCFANLFFGFLGVGCVIVRVLGAALFPVLFCKVSLLTFPGPAVVLPFILNRMYCHANAGANKADPNAGEGRQEDQRMKFYSG